jgi:hypothetical protein
MVLSWPRREENRFLRYEVVRNDAKQRRPFVRKTVGALFFFGENYGAVEEFETQEQPENKNT